MEQKNKLIVEFLELEPCDRCVNYGGFYCSPHGQPTSSHSIINTPSEMKYHLWWDWLMPVVEKIESIYHEDHGYFGVYISSNGCTIQGTKFRPDAKVVKVYYDNVVLSTKIESTYECVIRFIKWYLKNIKNK